MHRSHRHLEVPATCIGGTRHNLEVDRGCSSHQMMENNDEQAQAQARRQQERAQRIQKFHESIKEFRGWISTVAALIASFTYQAGLNPPGGFWGNDGEPSSGKVAGTSILLHKSPLRYYLFASGNAVAFASSLYVIFWIGFHEPEPAPARAAGVEPRIHSPERWLFAALFLDMVGFSVAYTAGSSTSTALSLCTAFVLAVALGLPAAQLAFYALPGHCKGSIRHVRDRWCGNNHRPEH